MNQGSLITPQVSNWFTQQSAQLLQQLNPLMNQLTQTNLAAITQPQLTAFQAQINTGATANAG
jgi:hypothetical protein